MSASLERVPLSNNRLTLRTQNLMSAQGAHLSKYDICQNIWKRGRRIQVSTMYGLTHNKQLKVISL